MLKIRSDNFAKILFVLSIVSLIWCYGVFSAKFNLFPYNIIKPLYVNAKKAIDSLFIKTEIKQPWWYVTTSKKLSTVKIYNKQKVSDGLMLIDGIKENNNLMAKIIDNQGNTIHEWKIDFFEMWPEPNHLNEKDRPKSRPGKSIHGMILMPNGDLVFNFDGLGMIRIDICGNVVWRLPYRTHHSLHRDHNGNLWASGEIRHYKKGIEDFPNYIVPFVEFTILEVSPDGAILNEISVFDLLIKNGLKGLLYLSSIEDWSFSVKGDTLHLNDVEPFPFYLEEGIFEYGDIMISLRNINAILVFNKETWELKYINIGNFIRQHDPDFIDGNTISVFDNNNISISKNDIEIKKSRIVQINVPLDNSTVVYEGSRETPFFTGTHGKHQYLENGNLLITESRNGRVFEITQSGEIVLEYFNIVKDNTLGIISGAQRLPSQYSVDFFKIESKRCVSN